MANTKQNHWYVLALTTTGPKFVTALGEGRTCYWRENDAPKEFNKDYARDMCIGLTWNGTPAFPVCVNYEIPAQPFVYKLGKFRWEPNEEKGEKDNGKEDC